MKNKKMLIISLIMITLIIMILIIVKPFYDSNAFDKVGQDELIEQLRKIEDINLRQQEIERAIEKGWITEKIAQEI